LLLDEPLKGYGTSNRVGIGVVVGQNEKPCDAFERRVKRREISRVQVDTLCDLYLLTPW